MTKHSNRPPASGRRLHPSNDTARIAGSLAQFSANTGPETKLLVEVEAAIRSRVLRTKYIPSELLGEPAWDILLELMRTALLNRSVTVAELGSAVGLAGAVARRWVDLLVGNGLCRWEEGADEQHVALTPQGSATLRGYFEEPAQESNGRQP